MRITGGTHRSRALVAPKGQATRPTSDRVREALFSMLVSDGVFSGEERGPRVLDLYAGSGALGFEALSRGASRVVFVETARPALTAIRENAEALAVTGDTEILALRADRALAKDELGPFELVLLDPPYADVKERAFTEILAAAAKRLVEGGVLVLEHASNDEPSVPGLEVDRRRRHGDTTLSLFRRT